MRKQITILGATGAVGQRLLHNALKRGINVKILARSKEKLSFTHPNLEIVEGNYFDLVRLDEAISGSSIILSTIGPPLKGKLKIDDIELYHKSLEHILSSLKSKKGSKFINITGAAIRSPGEKLTLKRTFLRWMLKMMAKQMIIVKDEELSLLFNSTVEFVSVRPPMIKKVTGDVHVDKNSLPGMSVDYDQLCNFMLDCIELDSWNRQAPLIATK